MKRYLIITFSLLLFMGVSSFATNTRVLTMGDNNMILLDEANIWLFPSRINDYPNLAIGEFGQPGDFTEFGIHWKFKEENPCVLGMYLHNSTAVYPMSSPVRTLPYFGEPYGYDPSFVPFDWSLMSNQRIDLIYGRYISGKPFGIHLGIIHSSQKRNDDDPSDGKDEEGFAVYHLAVGLTPNPNTDIVVGLELMTWTDKETDDTGTPPYPSYNKSKPKGNKALYAMARRFFPDPWGLGTDYTAIPHAAIFYAKNEAEYYSTPPPSLLQTDKYTRSGVELGVGLQYAPSSDAMAVIDFGLRYGKLDGEFAITGAPTNDASLKTVTVPFFKAGADVKVFDWMDLRLGATSYWDRYTLENDSPYKLTQNYADNATYLGFGFHWGNLHVDTYTDPDLFLDGFNFISGTTNNMNFQISALYEIM